MQPWLIPMLYVIGAVAGGLTLPRIEHAWQTDAAIQAFELSVSSAQAYLSAAASGMMALTGIVFAMFRCGYCARAVARAGRRARSGRDRLHLRRLRPFPPPPPPAVPASLAAVNAAATEAGLADPTGGWQPPGRPDPWMAGATPAYAADPGAAQRAALYRQLNPTGTPIGVPPSAMANPPSTAAAPAPAAAWQPPATDRLVPLTSSPPRAGGRALDSLAYGLVSEPQQRRDPAIDECHYFFDEPQLHEARRTRLFKVRQVDATGRLALL